VRQAPAGALKQATPWAEAFRVLRTNMQYVEVDHDQKVFVVTSALPAEGKSTTALNLAVTMAMAKHRVVLIEADLRRPQIASRLGLDDSVGTTSVLIGRVQLADALQEYEGIGLQVLASGPLPPNPSELLQSVAMEKLLQDLRDQFDVVIIDAPPLLPVTDAALLSAQADGALVVVRHSKTTRDQLAHAIERVEAVDAKVIGVVINMAPTKKSNSSYGYGYGYGYSYAPTQSAATARKPKTAKQPEEPQEPALSAGSGKPEPGEHRPSRRKLRW
jgi:capsular exopolysaccharide synthesis family protein